MVFFHGWKNYILIIVINEPQSPSMIFQLTFQPECDFALHSLHLRDESRIWTIFTTESEPRNYENFYKSDSSSMRTHRWWKCQQWRIRTCTYYANVDVFRILTVSLWPLIQWQGEIWDWKIFCHVYRCILFVV